MSEILECIHGIVWGAPVLILIIGVGIYLTLRTGFVQLRLFPQAMKSFLDKLLCPDSAGEGVSSFQALCTALAATVGTGNLVGVAGAICLGGPGAIFWMWICGILAMATKYAEVVLAVRYRIRAGNAWVGGPMVMITQALGRSWRWMAYVYAAFGMMAAFGVGNAAQINAVIGGINDVLSRYHVAQSSARNLWIGLILAVLIGKLLLGGAKPVGKAAQMLVPVVSAAYIGLCLTVLIRQWDRIPGAVGSIVQGAFSPRAVTGGMLGSAFQAMKTGCARGVFTNEAGMGTASIAHASAQNVSPREQGLMGIVEVFLDTLVICTMTALVILVSGVPVPYGQDVGGMLTSQAFTAVLGDWTAIFLAVALCCFAVATVLGWGIYGVRCCQFLFGPGSCTGFAIAQSIVVVAASAVRTDTVWRVAEILNGLMAVPNLIALAMLTTEVLRLPKEYKKTGSFDAGGGNYANFHQCKPLRTLSYAEIPSLGCGSQKGR